MKPNNVISAWIEVAMHTPSDIKLGMHIGNHGFDYAAKLNQLVEAARWYVEHNTRIDHSPLCSFWDDFSGEGPRPQCDCGKNDAYHKLTAALRDIELLYKENHGTAQTKVS